LITSVVGFTAYAESKAESYSHGGESDAQDGEQYAVAKGNRKEGDAVDNVDSCLSETTVKKYEIAARSAVSAIQKAASVGGRPKESPAMVGGALKSAQLFPEGVRLGHAAQAGVPLKAQGFVNLMDCPEWAKKSATAQLRKFRWVR